jgi:gamma-glutamylputrescine oxidase
MTPKDQVYWYSLRQPRPQGLKRDISVDLVVVGGGMAGLMCAQAGSERGLSTAVVEAQYCGFGASGKSSGFITPDSELELGDLITNYGPKCAKELWEFVLSGCEAIRKNIVDYSLDCDYQVQDSLFIANSKKGAEKVRHEYESRQQLNYESEFYSAGQTGKAIGSSRYYGAVRYPGTFGMVSYLYCQELKDVLVHNGAQIYESTPVTSMRDHTLTTPGGTITAKSIVFCADRFLPDLGVVPLDIYHAQTFLGLSRPLSEPDQHKLFPDKPLMVWDTDLIYQYFRLTGEGRLLLGGASLLYTYAKKEKHRPGIIIKKLQDYWREKFPELTIELEYLWPGLIGVSKDFLPLAGKHHQLPDVYYVGGAAGLP